MASSKRDQRRSQRHRCVLDVEVGRGDKKFSHVKSYDVSKHGLFVFTADPPADRHLVQLIVKLPDGPLPATAFVSRRVPDRGAGLEMFALSAQSKERWDAFIDSLEGRPESHPTTATTPELATFLVRLRSEKRLQEFLEKNYESGGLYMATPVIKEAGAEIALAVIHPLTEQEYQLLGRVTRVHKQAPKGMEVEILGRDPKSKAAFREFVKTGLPPAMKKKHSGFASESGDISIDIVVDESLIEESAQFEWGEVSSDLVVDFELAEWAPEDEAPSEAETPGPRAIEVTCADCQASVAQVQVGEAEGGLAPVAEHRVYECIKCKTLRSTLRVKSVDDRKTSAQAIDPEQPARIADLFAVAEMSAVARCAVCSGNLKSTRASKLFERTARELKRGGQVPVEELACPQCNGSNLRMTRR